MSLKPKYRYELKSRIVGAGYRTLTDFSKATEIDLARISRICGGYEYPGKRAVSKMSEALNLSVKEIGDLL
jgi:hypothetical protein